MTMSAHRIREDQCRVFWFMSNLFQKSSKLSVGGIKERPRSCRWRQEITYSAHAWKRDINPVKTVFIGFACGFPWRGSPSSSLPCSSFPSSLILPIIHSVIQYSICCTDSCSCSLACMWRWGNRPSALIGTVGPFCAHALPQPASSTVPAFLRFPGCLSTTLRCAHLLLSAEDFIFRQ